MKNPICKNFVLIAGLAALCVATIASDVRADKKRDADAISLEMFAAMDAGQVDVKIIPQDATKANVIIKNLLDQPVHLKLPDAFASVPVLAQGMMGGMGGGGMGGGGMGGGGGQAGGGGMGGGGMGGGGMGGGGMGGGMMRVAPERAMKFAVQTVCLEHGKPDPNPRMPYKIIPLEQFTANAEVKVLCESLGFGRVTQNTAQAAAWHMMDGLSWQALAAKNRVESKYTGNVSWFSGIELRTAQAVVSEVSRIARERSSKESQSDSVPAYDETGEYRAKS